MTVQTVPSVPVPKPADQVPATPVADAPSGGAAPAAAGSDAPPTVAAVTPPAASDSAAALPEGPKPAEPAVPKEDWRDKRIATLTARLRERERQGATPQPAAAGEAPLTQADVDRLADQKAAAIAAAQSFNERCNAAAIAGRAAFPDFNTRLGELTKLVDRQDQESVGTYNRFLQAALETGQAPKVIHALGGDLNEAARIMALPPAAQGVALARLADKEPEPVSRVPKPITPVGGRGAAATEIDPRDPERADNLTTDAWMERRAAQIAARPGGQR